MLHELTHFRRGDLWLDVLVRAMCALHWFNPFVWQLARRLALERELACDAVVGARCNDKMEYAAMLLDFAAARIPKAAPEPGLAMASRRARDLRRAFVCCLDQAKEAIAGGRSPRLSCCRIQRLNDRHRRLLVRAATIQAESSYVVLRGNECGSLPIRSPRIGDISAKARPVTS